MSDETTQQAAQAADVAAENAAPVTDTTAVSADSPVAGEETPKPEAKETPKTFTQEELNQVVSKEKARTDRKWQREIQRQVAEALKAQQPQAQGAAPAEPSKPTAEQFQSTEEYVAALARYEAEKLYEARKMTEAKEYQEAQQRRHHETVVTTYQQRVEAAIEKYPDFEEVAYSDDVPITNAMAMAIQESEMGPDIAYYLGKNVAEAQRIAKLSPLSQAKELGKLEAKIAAAPAPAKPSKAPEPITPINASKAGTTYVDTTDPKSLEKLGTSGWIEAERKRQIAKWEQSRR